MCLFPVWTKQIPRQPLSGALFQTGYTCDLCGTNPTGIATVDFAYQSIHQELLIPYKVVLNFYSDVTDKLVFYASQTVEFDLGNNQQLQVTTESYNGMVSLGGAPVTYDIKADFAVVDSNSQSTTVGTPEPSSLWLTLTGACLFAVATIFQRRRLRVLSLS